MTSPAQAAKSGLRGVKRRLTAVASDATRRRIAARRPQIVSAGQTVGVEAYWEDHTVPQLTVWTERGSLRQLDRRFAQYPLFREFSGLWGAHDGERLLDYGCGPGNDLTGFAVFTKAEKIIGIDVSLEALSAAADRLAIHAVDTARLELIHAPEGTAIPLADESVDFFQSQGVLHHTTDPQALLAELHRVARPGAEGRIMVYNRDSVWRHLYVAYELMLGRPDFAGYEIDDAFRRSTDGLDCPISRNYSGEQFVEMCQQAGFEARYLGGYLSSTELEALRRSRTRALVDDRLDAEHREFLNELEFDSDGLPTYRGLHAGIGGSYVVRRAE